MIFKKQYFLGFYFRDYQRLAMKKGIKFCDSNVLNFILFSKSLNFLFHFLWFLELSEELQQLQEMARKFSHEEIVPFAAEYDKTGEVKREFVYFTLYIVHVVCHLLPSFLLC